MPGIMERLRTHTFIVQNKSWEAGSTHRLHIPYSIAVATASLLLHMAYFGLLPLSLIFLAYNFLPLWAGAGAVVTLASIEILRIIYNYLHHGYLLKYRLPKEFDDMVEKQLENLPPRKTSLVEAWLASYRSHRLKEALWSRRPEFEASTIQSTLAVIYTISMIAIYWIYFKDHFTYWDLLSFFGLTLFYAFNWLTLDCLQILYQPTNQYRIYDDAAFVTLYEIIRVTATAGVAASAWSIFKRSSSSYLVFDTNLIGLSQYLKSQGFHLRQSLNDVITIYDCGKPRHYSIQMHEPITPISAIAAGQELERNLDELIIEGFNRTSKTNHASSTSSDEESA